MKTYRVYQVDAFTTERFYGNPAGVVSNADGLSDREMQDIARELNNSETAFILSPISSDHDVWVRFFTPKTEVPICGHATISAHFIRAIEAQMPSCITVQKTGAGILPVEIIKEDNIYNIVMTQGTIEISEPLKKDICEKIMSALHLGQDDLDTRCPIQIISTGHSKVMIGIRNKSQLNTLEPNFTALTEISRLIKCNGFFVFTFDSDIPEVLTHGRMFAPAIGIAEDPVTGNANGPLGAYLIHHGLVEHDNHSFHFTAQQGEAIGRTGRINVTVEIKDGNPVKVKVGGRAVIAFQTTIEI